MLKQASLLVLVLLACASVAGAQQSAPTTAATASAEARKICQYVVSPDPGAKPYQLCLTKAEWDAKRLADAKDANRIVCRYQEIPGTHFRSAKICQPASQWEEQRRLDREVVERIQRDTCLPGAGC